MSLSDIFSIPFLICLSLCILLIGCSSIFFYQKISQQDHKISSMIGLISTMAEENQAFRLSLSNARHIEMANPSHGGGQRMTGNLMGSEMLDLIPVSDDESSCESDSDEESDSCSSSDSESSSDEKNNELEDDDENETHVIKITDENFNFATDDFPFDNNESETESNAESNDDDLEHDIEDFHEITFDGFVDAHADNKEHNHIHENEHLEIFDFDKSKSNNIKKIHLEIEQMSITNQEIKDVSIFKAMNNSDPENSGSQSQKTMDTVDYKKMSITKLREIVSKQGVTDASKLRKPEILKLLGVEQ